MKECDKKICKNCKSLMKVHEKLYDKNQYHCWKDLSRHEEYSGVYLNGTCDHFDRRNGKMIRFSFAIPDFIPGKIKKVIIQRNGLSAPPKILTETDFKNTITHCPVCGKTLRRSIYNGADEGVINSFVRKKVMTCGNEKCIAVRKELLSLEKLLMKLARSK